MISVFAHADDLELKDVFQLIGEKPSNVRVDILTNHFLNKPFIDYPLGEGHEFDERPRWRIDGFDCATFVETITALALSPSLEEFEDTVIKVRYKTDQPTFITRAHFPDADWNSNLINRGLAKDITRIVGGRWANTYTYKINRKGWYSNLEIERTFPRSIDKLKLLRKLGENFGEEEVSYPFIPITDIIIKDPDGEARLPKRNTRYKVNYEILDRIPNGAIFGLLRPQQMDPKKYGTKQAVSHRGFVIRSSELKWRHMTVFKRRSVESDMLEELMYRFEDSNLLGIQFLQLQE